MSRMYNVDYGRLLLFVVPGALHKKKLIAFLTVLITPVKQLYFDFLEQRRRDWYVLAHNGQVCYLRAALNDSFDFYLRRITILNGNRFERLYVYTKVENRPQWLGLHLRPSSDYSDTGVDFIVKIPPDLEFTTNKHAITALINDYKLASKRFKIIYE